MLQYADMTVATGGWLDSIRHRPTPHCDQRPTDSEIELIVVHNVSLPAGRFNTGCPEEFFAGAMNWSNYPELVSLRQLRVAPHVLINRDGSAVQFVPFFLRAWHAGVSCWRGRPSCNDFSIGIELEGSDDIPYEPAQYDTLSAVVVAALNAYPRLSMHSIAGHCDVAPGRKTDPGKSFDWHLLHRKVKARGYNQLER